MKHECRGLQIEEIVQQMDNHNTIKDPYIEEEQTTQWPKEKVQKTNNDLQNIHIKLKIE